MSNSIERSGKCTQTEMKKKKRRPGWINLAKYLPTQKSTSGGNEQTGFDVQHWSASSSYLFISL